MCPAQQPSFIMYYNTDTLSSNTGSVIAPKPFLRCSIWYRNSQGYVLFIHVFNICYMFHFDFFYCLVGYHIMYTLCTLCIWIQCVFFRAVLLKFLGKKNYEGEYFLVKNPRRPHTSGDFKRDFVRFWKLKPPRRSWYPASFGILGWNKRDFQK